MALLKYCFLHFNLLSCYKLLVLGRNRGCQILVEPGVLPGERHESITFKLQATFISWEVKQIASLSHHFCLILSRFTSSNWYFNTDTKFKACELQRDVGTFIQWGCPLLVFFGDILLIIIVVIIFNLKIFRRKFTCFILNWFHPQFWISQ